MTALWRGESYPRGARYDGAGTDVARFSKAATRVEVCLSDDGRRPVVRSGETATVEARSIRVWRRV